jgi:membrane protein
MKKNKIKTIFVDLFRIFKNSFKNFGTNRPVQMAGTTAYFAIFSMAPILIIIIAVIGYITGKSTIREKLFEDIEVVLGSDSTVILQEAINNYKVIENSTIGTIVGIIVFIVSATALFTQLQNSINFIWRVKVKSSWKISVINLLRTRLFSFIVILGLGLLFLVSLIVDASIKILRDFLVSQFSSHFIILVESINLIVSLGIVAVVTAFIYRFLPDVHVNWSASWFGAAFTSVFFAIGRIIIGIVLRNSEMGIVYGAAGSFIIILIWIFFVSLIFYFGVELTHQFSRHHAHDNKPRNYAGTFEIHSVE